MKPLALVIAIALTACSGGSGNNLPFTPNSEFALPGQLDDGGPDLSAVAVDLAKIDQGPVGCTEISDGGISATGQALGIFVIHTDGTAITAGTYIVVASPSDSDAGNLAGVELFDSDAGFLASGTSGTVTVSSVGSTITGSFTAVMALGVGMTPTYSASFNAPLCQSF